jgi:hypothetical protein
VPISADTKPAPPAQSNPRLEIDEALELQLHVPNNMLESPGLGKCHWYFLGLDILEASLTPNAAINCLTPNAAINWR